MRWFVPSWSGDFRLEAAGDGKSVLTVERPTLQERKLLGLFLAHAFDAGWIAEPAVAGDGTSTFDLTIGVDVAGPALVDRVQPKDRTLTAVRFQDGHLEVAESSDLKALARRAKEKEAPAAVSVKRPTPSCPECVPGAVGPASEVLLTFLDEEQHRDWARYRALTVMGAATGHTYMIAHRHSPIARRIGRIAFDVSDRAIMHFFDWTVPPEEEVLAAMLILESREHWLRNEATKMSGHRFKNPFGDKWEGFDESLLLGVAGQIVEAM